MSVRRAFHWLILAVLVGTQTLVGVVAAHATAADNTPVVVVFDATDDAACRSWIGSPEHEMPCTPGSVISSYVTTAHTAKQQQLRHVYVETGNKANDRRTERQLVQALRKELAGQQPQPLACVQRGPITKGGSYRADVGNPNSPWVEYKFEYKVWNNCSVTDIWDWSRTTLGSTEWERSCSRANQVVCRDRNIIINANWSQQWWIDNTDVNQEYWHISDYCVLCRENYGINTFTN